jgi:hypothetical protein
LRLLTPHPNREWNDRCHVEEDKRVEFPHFSSKGRNPHFVLKLVSPTRNHLDHRQFSCGLPNTNKERVDAFTTATVSKHSEDAILSAPTDCTHLSSSGQAQ